MKRGIVLVAVATAMAGVASATVFMEATPDEASPRSVRQAAAPAVPRSVEATIKAPPLEAAEPSRAPLVVQKASLDARQAPVPLLVRPRPPLALPAVDAATTGRSELDQSATGDAFDEGAAKAAIEADGYRGVRVLRKGGNGAWHAKALRGDTEVMLTVDESGSVRAD